MTSHRAVHPHVWSRDSIRRFWDFNAGTEGVRQNYFTKKWAREIVRFASFMLPLKGAFVLDYGCGPGFLAEEFLKAGARVQGLEMSPESVQSVEDRLAATPGWGGCRMDDGAPGPLPWDHPFDLVCCIETIEHPLEEDLTRLLGRIRGSMAAGGLAFFTTPHRERLEESVVACPECGTSFHRWQHVRSWSAEQLRARLEEAGFYVPFCMGMSFEPFGFRRRLSLGDLSLRVVGRECADGFAGICDVLHPRPFPRQRVLKRLLSRCWDYNLVAVARRRD